MFYSSMVFGDPLVQKILERKLNRKLTPEEKAGLKVVRYKHFKIRVPQVSLSSLFTKGD